MPRFIDDVAIDKFEWISQKGFITQRTIIPSEFRKLDLDPVLKFFYFQKWSHILSLPTLTTLRCYINFLPILGRVALILNSFLVLMENILLTTDFVNLVLKTKIEEGCRSKIANFFLYEEFLTAYHHFYTEKLMTYFHTRFNTPAEAKLEDFSPQNLIIFTIISNLLVPTNGHRTYANKMKLYLFYCFPEKI